MSDDLQIDTVTKDIVFTTGDLVLVTGLAAVGQRINDRLGTFLTEWFLDTSYGPNYLRDVFTKNPSITLIHSILVVEATKSLQDEAVLVEFLVTLDSTTRVLTVDIILRDPDTQEELRLNFPVGV